MATDLEKIVHYWEITQKSFDNIDDKTKLEWFTNLVDKLEEKNSIKKLQEIRNTMTEDQKLKLYKKDAKDLGHFLLSRSPVYCIARSEKNAIVNTKKHWVKYASKYALLEQIPCRFLVQLCVLDKPEKLSNTQLCKDTKKDAKHMNIYLWVGEKACMVIPGAEEVAPFISQGRHYLKWYEKNWVPVMQERIRNQQIAKTEKSIAETLFVSEESILESEVIQKNAA